jgi:hypothetical protein
MNVFNKSYRFYEAGAPYPGVCLTCSNVNKLWDLGMISGTNRGAYLCDTCLQDLALFAGFVLKGVYEKETSELRTKIEIANNQIDAAPKLIKELTHDLTSILGNFVTSLASVTGPSKPVQFESPKADVGSTEQLAGPSKKSSAGSAKTSKSGTQSTEQ